MKRRNFLTLIAAAVGLPIPSQAKKLPEVVQEIHTLGPVGDGLYVYRHFVFGAGLADFQTDGVGRVFTWAQIAKAENIPETFLPPPGEWLKLAPAMRHGGFEVAYLWQGKWSELKYSWQLETAV